LGVQQYQADPGSDVHDAGTGTATGWKENGVSSSRAVYIGVLPEYGVPPVLSESCPIMIAQYEIAGRAGFCDHLQLSIDPAFCLRALWSAREGKTFGINVVAQKDHHLGFATSGKLLVERQEHRFPGWIRITRIADQIEGERHVVAGELGNRS
jgi:hypothetical protein